MREDEFVGRVEKVTKRILPGGLIIRRGASLLYEVTVDHRLEIRVDPKKPSRGHAAFQTDLCVFEILSADLEIPRVVLELKPKLSTHDVPTFRNDSFCTTRRLTSASQRQRSMQSSFRRS